MSAETALKNRSLTTLLAIALCGVALAAVYVAGKSARGASGARVILPSSPSSSDNTGPVVPSFEFHDQRGRVVTKRDLVGRVWIADFMYTACQSACPLLTSRLVTVQRRLRDPRLNFVSFSVDPGTDTPDTLNSYAKRWNANETRWLLLSTDQAGLARLISSMQVDVSRAGSEVIHSDRFFLIDERGTVIGSFDSTDDDALARLLAEAGKRLGSAPAATVLGSAGDELFSSLGCGGCHSDAQLAPPLAGLSGAHVMLERGGSVVADDAYIRASIVSPAAQLVAGYPSSMPAYGNLITSGQLDALVSYVRSLRGMRPTEAAATSQVDPVCGMPVRVTQATPSAHYEGQPYHFCSSSCARLFQRDPARYLHVK